MDGWICLDDVGADKFAKKYVLYKSEKLQILPSVLGSLELKMAAGQSANAISALLWHLYLNKFLPYNFKFMFLKRLWEIPFTIK